MSQYGDLDRDAVEDMAHEFCDRMPCARHAAYRYEVCSGEKVWDTFYGKVFNDPDTGQYANWGRDKAIAEGRKLAMWVGTLSAEAQRKFAVTAKVYDLTERPDEISCYYEFSRSGSATKVG